MSVKINFQNYPINKTTKLDLYSLESDISQLVNLEKLYLNYNNLTTLPESIGNLEKLKLLDIPFWISTASLITH
jgi:Leucine-rich repeat (LRR) protein